MIATFLRTPDGDFDIPALAVSLPAFLVSVYIWARMFPKAIRERQLWIKLGNWGRMYHVERDKRPKLYWFCIGLFCVLGGLAFLAIAFVFSTGKMRG
jgi:hypothetical protein